MVWINLERYKKYTQPPLRWFTMLLPLSQTLDPFDSCELVNLAKFHPPVPSLLIVLPPILKILQKNRENGIFDQNAEFSAQNYWFSTKKTQYLRLKLNYLVLSGHFGPKMVFFDTFWSLEKLLRINYFTTAQGGWSDFYDSFE